MLRILKKLKQKNRAQSLIEYTTVIGIVIVILLAVQPMIKRNVQGMIKSVADQIGNQEAADQEFDPQKGYMVSSHVDTQVVMDEQILEDPLFNVSHHLYSDDIKTNTKTQTNLGYTKNPPRN